MFLLKVDVSSPSELCLLFKCKGIVSQSGLVNEVICVVCRECWKSLCTCMHTHANNITWRV